MNRRHVIFQSLAAIVAGQASLGLGGAMAQTINVSVQTNENLGPPDFVIGPDHPLQLAWKMWKGVYLTPDGRVVDGFQHNASHSEGQGYGLVLAMYFGDLEAAQLIIEWTETNLALRDDGLLAWRWMADATPPVADMNNASDGDLFYAWGLSLHHWLTNDAGTYLRAKRIMLALEQNCLRTAPDGSGRLLFLPASLGFEHDGGYVINPSYYMARAFRDFAYVLGLPIFARLALDGETMMGEISARSLVPDWVYWGPQGIGPAPEPFSTAYGYEAMRVPLFALWSTDYSDNAVAGEAARTQVLRRAVEAYAQAGLEGGTPTIMDPASGQVIERSLHPGYTALAELESCVIDEQAGSLMPQFTVEQPYYPATLQLMALVVQVRFYPRCVPI